MISLATGTNVWSNAVSEMGQVNKRDVPAVVADKPHNRFYDTKVMPVAQTSASRKAG